MKLTVILFFLLNQIQKQHVLNLFKKLTEKVGLSCSSVCFSLSTFGLQFWSAHIFSMVSYIHFIFACLCLGSIFFKYIQAQICQGQDQIDFLKISHFAMDLNFQEPRLYPVNKLIPFHVQSQTNQVQRSRAKVKQLFLKIQYFASYLVCTFFGQPNFSRWLIISTSYLLCI